MMHWICSSFCNVRVRSPAGELGFRVLALGDSTYSQFCEAGRKLEELLLGRGAATFAARLDVDLDYEEPVERWSEEILDYGRAELKPRDSEDLNGEQSLAANYLTVVPPASPATSQWTRKSPFLATVQQVQKITGLESDKEVYHLELALEDSGSLPAGRFTGRMGAQRSGIGGGSAGRAAH